MTHVPTVEEILVNTSVGKGWHDFPAENGIARVTTQELRAALEDAYSLRSANSNWLAFVDIYAPNPPLLVLEPKQLRMASCVIRRKYIKTHLKLAENLLQNYILPLCRA